VHSFTEMRYSWYHFLPFSCSALCLAISAKPAAPSGTAPKE